MNNSIRLSGRMREWRPYTPTTTARTPRLKLDTNECPSLLSIDELRSTFVDNWNRYPDLTPLRQAIARRLNIEDTRIAVTSGADDAIDRICRALLDQDREMITTSPTFEMIPRSARASGARVRAVSWLDEAFPIQEILANTCERTGVIAVVSPNNPTGSVISRADLIALSVSAPQAVILLDLAYIEFADIDLTSLALSLPNVIITRTFSKAFGLAGLRVGFAAGDADLIRAVNSVGGPYPVTSPAIAAAKLALEVSDTRLRNRIERVRVERNTLTQLLRAQGAQVIDSQANFVYVRSDRALGARLTDFGIAVRTFGRDRTVEALRITCPCNESDFRILLEAITVQGSQS